MATFLDQITKTLAISFEEFQHHLEVVPETDRITGFVISSSFHGKDDQRRQAMMWKVLRDKFTPHELQRIGAIVAMTPEEAVLHESSD